MASKPSESALLISQGVKEIGTSSFGFKKKLTECSSKHIGSAARAAIEVLSLSNRFSPDLIETLTPHIQQVFTNIKDLVDTPTSKTPKEIKDARVSKEFDNPVTKILLNSYTHEDITKMRQREILTYFKSVGYTLIEVNEHLPKAHTISDYAWTKACWDLKQYGVGMTYFQALSTKSKVTRQYDEIEFIAARDFIKREQVTQGHSYGTHIVIDTKGTPQEMPSWIRCMTIESA